jgi:hypothetical protein
VEGSACGGGDSGCHPSPTTGEPVVGHDVVDLSLEKNSMQINVFVVFQF